MHDPLPRFDLEAQEQLKETGVRMTRRVTLCVCLFIALALAYASWVQMDVVVTAQGRVVAAGHSKQVQAAQAGVVRRIAVRDGQAVTAGDLLIELDPTDSAADRDRLARDHWEALADVARLSALAADAQAWRRPPGLPAMVAFHQQALFEQRRAEESAQVAALQTEIARREADRDAAAANLEQSQRSEPLVRRKLALREELASSGYISGNGLIDAQMEALQAQRDIAVQVHRLREAQAAHEAAVVQGAQVRAQWRARHQTELLAAMQRRDGLSQELLKAQQRHALHTVRSPVQGVVQQLAVSTEGAVVSQGQQLLVVVPSHPVLEVEAQVLNRDIGHVQVGQPVVAKVEAFDFTRYGAIAGEVSWVGADALQDAKQGPVYPVRIQLQAAQTPQAGTSGIGRIAAGMSVAADIRTSQRRLIEYFLSPLLRYKQEALRER